MSWGESWPETKAIKISWMPGRGGRRGWEQLPPLPDLARRWLRLLLPLWNWWRPLPPRWGVILNATPRLTHGQGQPGQAWLLVSAEALPSQLNLTSCSTVGVGRGHMSLPLLATAGSMDQLSRLQRFSEAAAKSRRDVGLGGQGGIAGDSPLTQLVRCGGPRAPGPSTQHIHEC